jgi:hypothetical protein
MVSRLLWRQRTYGLDRWAAIRFACLECCLPHRLCECRQRNRQQENAVGADLRRFYYERISHVENSKE